MNISYKPSQTVNKVWSSSWGLDGKLTTSHFKKETCYKMLHRASHLWALVNTAMGIWVQ